MTVRAAPKFVGAPHRASWCRPVPPRSSAKIPLPEIGRKDVILAGLMTHMCISSTARAGLDLGYRITVDADSCATRDLPDGRGGAIAAATIHDVALAELSDRFAIIARGEDALV